LIYTLYTSRDVFATEQQTEKPEWPLWKGLSVLAAGTAGTAGEADLVSGALQGMAMELGVTPYFLGVVVLAVLGNAAEYFSAAAFARQNQMDVALAITVGSSIQVALLVAPLLVLVSSFMGHPMNLVFANPLELVAIAAVAFIVTTIAHDGETTWFEGLMLVAVYLILALAFFFATP
jgi:Ca2+:H+ antiporter